MSRLVLRLVLHGGTLQLPIWMLGADGSQLCAYVLVCELPNDAQVMRGGAEPKYISDGCSELQFQLDLDYGLWDDFGTSHLRYGLQLFSLATSLVASGEPLNCGAPLLHYHQC